LSKYWKEQISITEKKTKEITYDKFCYHRTNLSKKGLKMWSTSNIKVSMIFVATVQEKCQSWGDLIGKPTYIT